MDIPENSVKLPQFNDRIILKATRISWQNECMNAFYLLININNNYY